MCLVSWKSVGADVCEKAVGTETASQLLPSQALQTSWVSCCIRSNSPWWTSLPLSGFDGFPSTCMCSRLIHKVSVCSLKVQQQLKCQTRSGLISLALPASSRLAQRNLFQKCLFFFFFNSVRHASFFYKLKYIYTVLDKYTVGNCRFFSVHLCLPTAYYY